MVKDWHILVLRKKTIVFFLHLLPTNWLLSLLDELV